MSVVHPACLLLPLLYACTGDKGPVVTDDTSDTADTSDTTDTSDTPADLAVGDVTDMATTADGSVSISVTEPGTYLVALVSLATDNDTKFKYASRYDGSASQEATPSAPFPATPARPVRPAMAVAPGDERTFSVYDGSSYQTITALATNVTDSVILWEDQTTPNGFGELDRETVDGVLSLFDSPVLPRERQVFGDESDVDGDGKVSVLLSYTVNEYGAVAYVQWGDIGVGSGVDSANGGEIIYLGIPDPTSHYSTDYGIEETVAHEFNHLIYAWHKLAENDQPLAQENPYITEGTSALAQDLTGYNNGNQYVWGAALDMSEMYGDDAMSIQSASINDVMRGAGGYDSNRDGVLRGTSYLFLRYLFEQAGGFTVESDGSFTDNGGIAWIHSFFDSPALGPDAVEETTGRSFDDVVMDWYTAIMVTGRVDNSNPAWNYQERVVDPITGYSFGMDPFANLYGIQLTGPFVQDWDAADGRIYAGGVEYLQVTITEATTLTMPVDPAAMARARVLRVE